MAKPVILQEFADKIWKYSSITLIIGSGLDTHLGLQGYYDYRPSQQKIDENSVIECSSLKEQVRQTYEALCELAVKDNISSIIMTYPSCIHRCIDNCRNIMKEKIICLTGCYPCRGCFSTYNKYVGISGKIKPKILIQAIASVTTAEALVIAGFTPSLKPANMLPLIAKYTDTITYLIDTRYNPYEKIVDYYVRSSIPWAIKKLVQNV